MLAVVTTALPLAVAILFSPLVAAAGENLLQPLSQASSDGALTLSLRLEEATIDTADYQLTTRVFNGSLPGPTLRLYPNDTLTINFTNALKDRGSPYSINTFSAASETNLHFHGLFVSGEAPSDDPTAVVRPGTTRVYTARLPADHMPGTHWLHPHRHGSSALQVGGGGAAAIIVQDPPDTLPAPVADAPDILLFLQPLDLAEVAKVATASSDDLFQGSFKNDQQGNSALLVNGQVNPVVRSAANEWVRLRIVHAGWVGGRIEFNVVRRSTNNGNGTACEMQLLAKDGIYIADFPRRISTTSVPPGGRADVMVRCPAPATTYELRDGDKGAFATWRTSDVEKNSAPLPTWTPTLPEYLQDLTATEPTAGCDCSITLSGNSVNGRAFTEYEFVHESYLGAVVQRNIVARGHPYHQHVYPFQIVGSQIRGNDGYVKIGDWHDTLVGVATVRYQPQRYVSKVMLHCHRLKHADRGMMALERVVDAEEGLCRCSESSDRSAWVLPGAIVGGVVSVGMIIGFGAWMYWQRKQEKSAREVITRMSVIIDERHERM